MMRLDKPLCVFAIKMHGLSFHGEWTPRLHIHHGQDAVWVGRCQEAADVRELHPNGEIRRFRGVVG